MKQDNPFIQILEILSIKHSYRIYRSDRCLFHLPHPRDQNGMFRSRIHSEKAMHDMNEVVNYFFKAAKS